MFLTSCNQPHDSWSDLYNYLLYSVCTMLLRVQYKELEVATWNYTSCNLEIVCKQFSCEVDISGPLLRRDPLWFNSPNSDDDDDDNNNNNNNTWKKSLETSRNSKRSAFWAKPIFYEKCCLPLLIIIDSPQPLPRELVASQRPGQYKLRKKNKMMTVMTYLTRVNPSAEGNGCPGQLKLTMKWRNDCHS